VTSYHLYDQIGSTRKLLDSSQATTYSYYAFGQVRSSSSSTTNPFKFVGRLGYYDDRSTDFQYLRARYYAPAHGRFCSAERDHLALRGYVYGDQAPLVFADPSGLWTICLPHRTSDYYREYISRGEPTEWQCYGAWCARSALEHPQETIHCKWKRYRWVEYKERWCRWWRCLTFQGLKLCKDEFEYRCTPWSYRETWEREETETHIVVKMTCSTWGPERLKSECKEYAHPKD